MPDPVPAAPRRWLPVALLVLAGLVTVGVLLSQSLVVGWLASWGGASGARYREAYTATSFAPVLEGSRQAERDRLIAAHTEEAPPPGFRPGPRLHPEGTVATLEWEAFDRFDRPLRTWRTRVLLPPPPDLPAGCSGPCTQAVAERRAQWIGHAGEAGLPAEWLLRTPVGTRYAFPTANRVTMDLVGPRLRDGLPDGKPPPPHAHASRLAVTLVEICAARVRIGEALRLEVFPNAILPIPKDFVVHRWAQVEGCPLPPLSPPVPALPAAEPAAAATLAIAGPPGAVPEVRRTREGGVAFAALAVARDGDGRAFLAADEDWLAAYGERVEYRIGRPARYDPARRCWREVTEGPPRHGGLVGAGGGSPRALFAFPSEPGVYAVSWLEMPDDGRSPADLRGSVQRSALVTTLPGDCAVPPLLPHSVLLATVSACVPDAGGLAVQTVPDPRANRCL